jgi:hypothetical protein
MVSRRVAASSRVSQNPIKEVGIPCEDRNSIKSSRFCIHDNGDGGTSPGIRFRLDMGWEWRCNFDLQRRVTKGLINNRCLIPMDSVELRNTLVLCIDPLTSDSVFHA